MMWNELDIVRDVSQRLNAAEIGYMLTGSMAMNYYAQPRMTRDIDVVIALRREYAERSVQPHPQRKRHQGGLHRPQAEQMPLRRIQSPAAHSDSGLRNMDCQQGRPDSFQTFMGQRFPFGITTPRREKSRGHRVRPFLH